jgi:hypothetical protein
MPLADNIALYCMSIWLTLPLGAYPKYPEVKNIDRPIQKPWLIAGGVYNYDGVITLNSDVSVLAADLNVQPDEIEPLFTPGPLSCSDADNSTSADICVDDTANPAIDLYGPRLPKPSDFNCNCGESGCSDESMPCCANGSCACDCNENGCAAEDPTCCANGNCAPLLSKMMPRFGRMKRN